jgi:transcriptional regulator with XRE-family HTH domain
MQTTINKYGHVTSKDAATYRKLGERLRQSRIHRRLTQVALAKKADLSPKYISMIERGQRNVSWEALCTILQALNFHIIFVPAESDVEVARKLVQILKVLAPGLQDLLNTLEQHDKR